MPDQEFDNLRDLARLWSAWNDTAEQGILIVDKKSRVLSFNERFRKMWNITERKNTVFRERFRVRFRY